MADLVTGILPFEGNTIVSPGVRETGNRDEHSSPSCKEGIVSAVSVSHLGAALAMGGKVCSADQDFAVVFEVASRDLSLSDPLDRGYGLVVEAENRDTTLIGPYLISEGLRCHRARNGSLALVVPRREGHHFSAGDVSALGAESEGHSVLVQCRAERSAQFHAGNGAQPQVAAAVGATIGDKLAAACVVAVVLLAACSPTPRDVTPWPESSVMPSGKAAPQPSGWGDYCRRVGHEGDAACAK